MVWLYRRSWVVNPPSAEEQPAGWDALGWAFLPIFIFLVVAGLRWRGVIGQQPGGNYWPKVPFSHAAERRRLDAQILQGSTPSEPEEQLRLRSRIWVHYEGWVGSLAFLALACTIALLAILLGFPGLQRTGFFVGTAIGLAFSAYYLFWHVFARRHPLHGRFVGESRDL